MTILEKLNATPVVDKAIRGAYYLTVHGSHGYGLNTPYSDLDVRGFFVQEPKEFFGLDSGQENRQVILENDPNFPNGIDVSVWEVKKFFRLALNANPNIIETLFTDPSSIVTSAGYMDEVRQNASDWFLSQKVIRTFGGYSYQQLTKLAKNLENWDAGTRKDAMHCARLMYFLEEMLKEGKLTVKIPEGKVKDHLLGIRNGDEKPVSTYFWAKERLERLEKMENILPPEPRVDVVKDFVYETLREYYR